MYRIQQEPDTGADKLYAGAGIGAGDSVQEAGAVYMSWRKRKRQKMYTGAGTATGDKNRRQELGQEHETGDV